MTLDFSEILVTGGAGFIGSNLVDRLIDEGFNVRVLDNLSTGDKKNLARHKDNKNFQFIEGDIRNFDLVKKITKGVDAVFHEAALVSVTQSVENPILSNEMNVTGTVNLLNACVLNNVKRFVFASSCSVYGDTEIQPQHENLIPKPLSPYAASKMAAEYYVKVFHTVYGLETIILRYFNVYGPRQKYGPYSGVISVFINNLLEDSPLTIYGDGTQTRDFVNVKDVIEANICTLSSENCEGDVFNIGTGKAISIVEIANTIQKIMDKTDLGIIFAESRPGEIMQSYADIDKARKSIKYEPETSIETGLKEIIEWYTNQ